MECSEVDKLKQEVKDLTDRLNNVRYESNSQLEDDIESLEGDVKTLKAALAARILKLSPGDVLYIDSADISNVLNYSHLMQITNEYGCNFVSAPGLDAMRQLSDLELEKLNLRKLKPGERATGLQTLEAMLVDVKDVVNKREWCSVEYEALDKMRSNLESTIIAFREFEKMVNDRLRG